MQPAPAEARERTPAPKSAIDWSPIFGYDVFVSYNWADARPYATRLEAELRLQDLRSFLDNTDAPPGVALSSTLKTSLRRSRTMVLLVSKGALRSPWVTQEVETFAKRGGVIIPVNLDGSVATYDPGNPILTILRQRDCIWIDDLAPGTIPASPAPATVEGIRRSFGYRRANKLRRTVTLAAFLILLAITITALWQWRRTRAQFVELQGRQLLIQAESLRRDTPADVAQAGLLALESQVRSPSPEAAETMRQSLAVLADPPLKTIPVNSPNAIWQMAPSGAWGLLVDGAKVHRVKLPSGEIERTVDIDEAMPASKPVSDEDRGPRLLRQGGTSSALSPDGTAAVVWNRSKELVLFDLTTGKSRWRQPFPNAVLALNLSDRGRLLAVESTGAISSGGRWQKVSLFSCGPQGCVDQPLQGILPDNATAIPALSRDGKRVALLQSFGTKLSQHTLGINDVSNPAAGDPAIFDADIAVAMTASPSLEAVATISGSKVLLYANGRQIELRRGWNSSDILLSASGRALVTMGRDGARVFDIRAAVAAVKIKSEGSDWPYYTEVDPIGYLPQATGDTLLSLREDGDLQAGCTLLTSTGNVATLWNCATGQPIVRAPHSYTVRSAARLPASSHLVTLTSKDLQIQPVSPAHLEFDHQGVSLALIDESTGATNPQVPVKITTDGTRAVVCAHTAIWLWDLASARLLAKVTSDQTIFACEFAGNGDYLVALVNNGTGFSSLLSVLRSQSTGVGPRALQAVVGGQNVPQWIASPTSPYIFMTRSSGLTAAIDIRGRKEPITYQLDSPQPGVVYLRRPTEPSSPAAPSSSGEQTPFPFADSEDGERLANIHAQTLRVWDAKRLGETPLFEKQLPGDASELTESPNHSRLAVRIGKDRALILDGSNGEQRASIALPGEGGPMRFDGAGRALAIYAAGKVLLYSAASGKLMNTLAPLRPLKPDEALGRWETDQGSMPLLGQFTAQQFVGFDGSALLGIDLDSGGTKWKWPVKRPRPFALIGTLLAIADEDNSVSLYDPVKCARVAQLGRQREITGMRAVGNDRVLFWGGSKMQQYRWVADPGAALCERLPNPLTREEWAKYLPTEGYRDSRAAYRGGGQNWLQRLWP